MKLYNPFKVQNRNGSFLLALCLLVMMCVAVSTIIALIIVNIPLAVILHTVAVLAIIRVVYAVIKGD